MKMLAALALLATAGCATTAPQQRDFFSDLTSLCGKSFAGRITSPAAAADADFAGKGLVMQVRECSADTIRVPFHVADDHSRTWVITRTATGLRLKHDHRHKDGSEDKVTQYGGDSVTPLTASRQEFPADQFTKDLLIREGNTAGANNIWAVEVDSRPHLRLRTPPPKPLLPGRVRPD